MATDQEKLLSRRAFASCAALFSASAAFLPEGMLRPSDVEVATSTQLPDNLPKLSSQGQAEAEARFQLVLSRYGSRFTDEDKRNIKTLCYFSQPGLERLRTFALKNEDVPALYLKPIVERDKAPQANRPATSAAGAPKHS
jgi:hypothetical protein